MKHGPLTRSLVFSGIKHCGKSTLGKLVAQEFCVPFIDTDEELESEFARREGRNATTREIFNQLGQEKFRRLEAEVVESLVASSEKRVISLGGGVPANSFLKPGTLEKLGFRVWLAIDPAIAYERVLRRGLPPFLSGATDPRVEFMRLNELREPFFRANADLVFPIERELSREVAAGKLVEAIVTELKL